MNDENIKLRKLENNKKDYKKLYEWCSKEEIYFHFEQRKLSYEEIKNKYYLRTLPLSNTIVYIIEYNNISIGLIQYKLIDKETKKIYELNDNNIYEIDIFIGELELHNKGIGQKSIELLINYLFNIKEADAVVMCPLDNNKKAISCYEKCGFSKNKILEMSNTIGVLNKYLLMINRKQDI